MFLFKPKRGSEKRKGRSRPASRLMACLIVLILLCFAFLILATRFPPLPIPSIVDQHFGKILFVARAAPSSGRQLYMSNGDGTDLHPMTYNDGTNNQLAWGFAPALSPDGSR